jgi:hypothetical protein
MAQAVKQLLSTWEALSSNHCTYVQCILVRSLYSALKEMWQCCHLYWISNKWRLPSWGMVSVTSKEQESDLTWNPSQTPLHLSLLLLVVRERFLPMAGALFSTAGLFPYQGQSQLPPSLSCVLGLGSSIFELITKENVKLCLKLFLHVSFDILSRRIFLALLCLIGVFIAPTWNCGGVERVEPSALYQILESCSLFSDNSFADSGPR